MLAMVIVLLQNIETTFWYWQLYEWQHCLVEKFSSYLINSPYETTLRKRFHLRNPGMVSDFLEMLKK